MMGRNRQTFNRPTARGPQSDGRDDSRSFITSVYGDTPDSKFALGSAQATGHMLRAFELAGVVGGVLWIAVLGIAPEDEIFRNRIWSIASEGGAIVAECMAAVTAEDRRSAR